MRSPSACPQCHRQFSSRKGQIFCSKLCGSKGRTQTAKMLIECNQCGKIFSIYKRKLSQYQAHFCSTVCRCTYIARHRVTYGNPPHHTGKDHPSYKEPTPRKCKYCGTTFYRKPWQLCARGATGEFCSTACRSTFRHEFQSGDKSPFWVGGITTIRGKTWLEARTAAVERDKGTCRDCGVHIGESIPVHHIKPFRDFKDEYVANTLDNLVCLCPSCHAKRDSEIQHNLSG